MPRRKFTCQTDLHEYRSDLMIDFLERPVFPEIRVTSTSMVPERSSKQSYISYYL